MADAPSERFRRVSTDFGDVVHRVPPDAWSNPAPCEGWLARDVVRHLVEWVPAVLGRSGIAPFGSLPVEDDPVGAWEALADWLQAALDDPTVAATEFDAGPPGMMTVEHAIDMLVTGDVLVHTWDLATATGVPAHYDQAIAQEMLVGMQPMDEMLRASGHFGPKVTVADDADTMSKLVAFTGRHP